MKIDYNNRKSVDSLNIHDSLFTGFSYLYDEREIRLSCRNFDQTKNFTFIFNNVLAFEMQSCSFWHGGNRILSISNEDNPPQLLLLQQIQQKNQKLYAGSLLDRNISYLSVVFEINSGDTLNIICQNFDFLETDIPKNV